MLATWTVDSIRWARFVFGGLTAGLLLAGCGGSESTASAPKSLLTIQSAVSRAQADNGAAATSAPRVVNLEKVSETRVSRTVFEYKFRIIAQGGEVNYKSGEFTVTAAGAGTTVLVGSAKLGQIASGDYVRSDGMLTLRHDRQLPFDMAALKYAFVGEAVSAVSPNSTVSISSVGLYKQGGRPGHGGSLPINTEHPLLGDTLELRVKVAGNPGAVTYAFADANGVFAAPAQPLQQLDNSDTYLAMLAVPGTASKIVVKATAGAGDSATWETKVFAPQQVAFNIELPNAVFARAQSRTGAIVSTPVPQAGNYVVTMTLPDGFQSPVTSWRVALKPGEAANIPVSITAPASGRISGHRVFVSWANASTATTTTFSSARVMLY